MGTPKINAWSGFAFERVCMQHIPEIKNALGISGISTTVNSWSCKKDTDKGIFGSQIDLLLVRKDQIINICEMKYSELEYNVDVKFDMSMRRKISDFQSLTGTKAGIHPILVTTYGVIENSYSNNLQKVITADDLFGG